MREFKNVLIALLRKFKIFNRIAGFLILTFLVFSLIILQISDYFTQRLTDSYVYDFVQTAQIQIATGLESAIDEMIVSTVRIKTNGDIYNVIVDDNLGYNEKLKGVREILETILSDSDKTCIGDIYIIDKSGESYELQSGSASVDAPDGEYLKLLDDNQYTHCHTVVKGSDDTVYVLYGLRMNNFYTGQDIGYLVIYIREEALFNVYKDVLSGKGYSFLLDGEQHVISHPDKSETGKPVENAAVYSGGDSFEFLSATVDGETSVIAEHQLSERMESLGFDWTIVSVMPYNKLFVVITQINKIILVIEIGMLIMAVLIAIFISKKLANSLHHLKNKLNIFGNGTMEVFLNSQAKDEIWELEISFNDMVVRINDLIAKNNEEKEKQKEMEFLALQAQINPHFLYNTLDTIGWIAKIKKQDDIELLVMQLAKFFRLSLHKGENYIMIDEEIQLVQSFVTIQQMLSKGKFVIEYNIPEEIRTVKMVKLVLQPLVENAIRHGIDEKKGEGHIWINASRTGDDIMIEVIDDGAGFDVSKTDLSNVKNEIGGGGYGLYNVDERLKHEYGQKYGLEIFSEVGRGTRVKVTFCIKEIPSHHVIT
jgi:two-component system sensor histidine kinase YesM